MLSKYLWNKFGRSLVLLIPELVNADSQFMRSNARVAQRPDTELCERESTGCVFLQRFGPKSFQRITFNWECGANFSQLKNTWQQSIIYLFVHVPKNSNNFWNIHHQQQPISFDSI